MKVRVEIPFSVDSKGKLKFADVKGAGSRCGEVLQLAAKHIAEVQVGEATTSMHEPPNLISGDIQTDIEH